MPRLGLSRTTSRNDGLGGCVSTLRAIAADPRRCVHLALGVLKQRRVVAVLIVALLTVLVGVMAFRSYRYAARLSPIMLDEPGVYLCPGEALDASSSTSGEKGSVTLVTHARADDEKLKRMMLQTVRWNGPVSAALYVTNDDELKAVEKFKEELDAAGFLKSTVVTVFREESGRPYPHNILRNLALDNSPTEYVLTMDVDFMVPLHSERTLSYLLHQANLCDRNGTIVRKGLDDGANDDGTSTRTAFILPVWEFLPLDRVIGEDDLPADADELLDLYEGGLAQPWKENHGHHYFHVATNYPRWMKNAYATKQLASQRQSQGGYQIQTEVEVAFEVFYRPEYEPYVVTSRHGAPRYEPGFRGYGYDKMSWILEMYCMGYRFEVLSDFYVIHMNHPPVAMSSRKENLNANEPILRDFKNRLRAEYPSCDFS